MAGEDYTGVTIMLMDESMDTGPILLQKRVDIHRDDDAGVLSKKLAEIGAEMLIPVIKAIAEKSIIPVAQEGIPSYAPPIKKEERIINWHSSAQEISNLVRGLSPSPGAYSFLMGERIVILKAEAIEWEGEPGVVEKVGKDELLVGTGSGLLSILELKPASKKRMSIRAFLQGRSIKKGMSFSASGS